MRKIIYLLFFIVAIACAHGQGSKPIWNATIKVLDESGLPIAGADVEMSWYVTAADGSETFDKTQGVTDANGLFITSHEANRSIDLGFTARKRGYYSTTKGHEFVDFNDNDPEKLNPHVTLVLKKIGLPIPMYAKGVQGGPPVFNQPVGYDLEAGDWAAPYGKGTNADIDFTTQRNGNDYKFIVSFRSPGDGIQEYSVPDLEKGSDFRSPHEAPANGYQTQIVRDANEFSENRIYLFRATLPDGPHYGKIYGDFMEFTYYLNPTPNDRNIEFDPQKNLIKHFRLYAEHVKVP